jgi:putative phosphoribosyl transferase
MAPYRDRTDAGNRLAAELADLLPADRGRDDVWVLALPRGGVPVAVPVADKLGARLSLLLVRKIGVPHHPELAMGAIAAINDRIHVVRNEPVIAQQRITDSSWSSALETEQAELNQRMADLGGWLPPALADTAVVLVDDGLATGQTMRAAIDVVASCAAGRVIVAAPVAAPQTITQLSGAGIEIVCPYRPEPMYAVGEAYQNFAQITDDEMLDLLQRQAGPGKPGGQTPGGQT